jgi:murein L,D-transpeptidase YafK
MRRRSFLASGIALLALGGTGRAAAPQPLIKPVPVALTEDAAADWIVVRKARREMLLYRQGEPFRRYTVAIGSGGPGPKRREGDKRTPEGLYRIDGRNPDSAYHLSLRIDYPGPHDVAAAEARGEPPGSDIMIHGLPNGLGMFPALFRRRNWTDGCIAVTNAEIEEIWRLVPDGTPIEIVP